MIRPSARLLSERVVGSTTHPPACETNVRPIGEVGPIGVVGVITAFNFPVAPWGWNFCLAIVCGNSVVWKPSPKTMEVSYLCKKIWDETVDSDDQSKLLEIIDGDVNEAKWMAQDKRINLLSATGSCEMGKALAPLVAERMGKGLYELGVHFF